jgi:hypothetical protein
VAFRSFPIGDREQANEPRLWLECTGEGDLGWATHYIARLQAGETVCFRPRGSSMKGKIESGQLCTVAPVDHTTLSVGDIVLCKVRGNLIKAISGPRFQIGNNRGLVNGWIGANGIYGKCIRIEP